MGQRENLLIHSVRVKSDGISKIAKVNDLIKSKADYEFYLEADRRSEQVFSGNKSMEIQS